MIAYDDFVKIQMHNGNILQADPFPEARTPAIKLVIDFGEKMGQKKTSAQITDLYEIPDLIGRQVVAVTNFPPKQIGPFMSEVLVLGGQTPDGVVTLLRPDQAVPNGTRIA